MVFKRQLTPLKKGGRIDKHVGKGATEEVLPSRSAMATLTKTPPPPAHAERLRQGKPPGFA